ncbi:hypothetical protein EDB89DRAFT_2018638 [Lactarius sanguifluus]|nr:hypothetical protein EDB89DRAFT_2018638 [Lactarius sanguifluus]
MQQCARQYQELAQQRGTPYKRACLRSFIFHGLRRFGILAGVVTPITGLLHVSIFLFFAGLVEFLFPIYTMVAYTTLGCIGMFTLLYAILTILPNIYLNCPCGTPMTDTTWRLSQFTMLGIFLAILRIEDPFHGPLLSVPLAFGSPADESWSHQVEGDTRNARHYAS